MVPLRPPDQTQALAALFQVTAMVAIGIAIGVAIGNPGAGLVLGIAFGTALEVDARRRLGDR